MGEIADAMLNGVFCAECGELMGDVLDDDFVEPGYPRRCEGCEQDDMDEPARPKRRSRRAKP